MFCVIKKKCIHIVARRCLSLNIGEILFSPIRCIRMLFILCCTTCVFAVEKRSTFFCVLVIFSFTPIFFGLFDVPFFFIENPESDQHIRMFCYLYFFASMFCYVDFVP